MKISIPLVILMIFIAISKAGAVTSDVICTAQNTDDMNLYNSYYYCPDDGCFYDQGNNAKTMTKEALLTISPKPYACPCIATNLWTCTAPNKATNTPGACYGEYSCKVDGCKYLKKYKYYTDATCTGSQAIEHMCTSSEWKEEAYLPTIDHSSTTGLTKTCPAPIVPQPVIPPLPAVDVATIYDDTAESTSGSGTDGGSSSGSSSNIINAKLKMAENNPIANSLCRGFVLIKGYIIPIIVLLWIITGIGFFIGKISWGIVIALAVGTTLTVASGKMAASYILNDSASDVKDACECRFGVNCDSPYE